MVKRKSTKGQKYTNTISATRAATTAEPSGAPEFTPGLSGVTVAQFFAFCVVFYRRSFFVGFLVAILQSVLLRWKVSGYLVIVFVCLS